MNRRALISMAVMTVFLLGIGAEAHARPYYLKSVVDVYPKLRDKLIKTKCATCHIGKGKNRRNEYGKKLGMALGNIPNVKEQSKVHKALRKIGPPPIPMPVASDFGFPHSALGFQLMWNVCGKLTAERTPHQPCEYPADFPTKTTVFRTRKPQVFHTAILDDRRRNVCGNQHLF